VTSANADLIIFLLLWLANGFANRSLDGLGEDVADTGRVLAQHVGVDAQGHRRVSVAKPGGHDVNRNAGEKTCGRVQVTQIVQPGMWQRPGRGSY
jgi:hypothetical protein